MTYAKVEQQPARFVSLGGRRRTPLTDHDHPELCLFSLALRPPQRYRAPTCCVRAPFFSLGDSTCAEYQGSARVPTPPAQHALLTLGGGEYAGRMRAPLGDTIHRRGVGGLEGSTPTRTHVRPGARADGSRLLTLRPPPPRATTFSLPPQVLGQATLGAAWPGHVRT